jgi:thiol:disulfide interchange protein DsbD
MSTLALSGFLHAGGATAQTPVPPVVWAVSASPGTAAKTAGLLTLDLDAQVAEGWHVYGLHQVDGGPSPLRITVDEQGVVQTAGSPTGTVPTRRRDASFGLDTELYLHPFSLHVPVQVKPHTAPGSQQIAVNVRFQACNDHVCLPPKTVRLTVPVQIQSDMP